VDISFGKRKARTLDKANLSFTIEQLQNTAAFLIRPGTLTA
jgi:hypothetical protein